MAATALETSSVLDMTGRFEDVFGERRGSRAEPLKQFPTLHADLKDGQLERTLRRLDEFNGDGTFSAHADNAPLQSCCSKRSPASWQDRRMSAGARMLRSCWT